MGWKKALRASLKLDSPDRQQSESHNTLNVPFWIDLQWRGLLLALFTVFSVLHEFPQVLGCDWQSVRPV